MGKVFSQSLLEVIRITLFQKAVW